MSIRPYYQSERVTLYHGDCLEILPTLDVGSVDSVVTDPPYGLSFMGKHWDYDVPGVGAWASCLRALKPGGHLLAFAGTRTQHRMAVNIEDSGFDVRDMIAWVYGSGFPKSLDVSKAIDKAAGAEREVVGTYMGATNIGKVSDGKRGYGHDGNATGGTDRTVLITAPATDAARQWSGWGTALKPAMEPITVARKPLDGTVAENVLAHGTGAINVDGCRIIIPDGDGWNVPAPDTTKINPARSSDANGTPSCGRHPTMRHTPNGGRWPANLIHDGSEEVVGGFPQANGSRPGSFQREKTSRGLPGGGFGQERAYMRNRTDIQKPGYEDSGSAARFFYCAKASKADRDDGCEELEAIHRVNGNKWTDQDYRVTNGERPPSAESGPRRNHHPTVKPTDLMRYLCRLVTPPDGIVLDPFAGSGSTGKAAMLEGFRFIGIERDEHYCEIAAKRIQKAEAEVAERLVTA